jgi:pyruvate kinase
MKRMKRIKRIITLGPKSLNKSFLISIKNKVDLLRLNMSHLNIKELKKHILFIKKYSSIPICIDTEGAQIRTKIVREKILKKGQEIKISFSKKDLSLYPNDVQEQLKINDILNVGFDNLFIKIKSKNVRKNFLIAKTISRGKVENNKGVHLVNRKIKLNYLTDKDIKAIEVGKKLKINYYALSFTNTLQDIISFNKMLKNKFKIFKIETLKAVKNFSQLIKAGDSFLIDRGDLSKDVFLEKVPIIQRKIFQIKKKNKSNKEIYIATNLLESMIFNDTPTRGEINDIYSNLEMGANGLVLAAETAIGKNPYSSIQYINKMIKIFIKEKKN